ncbi:RNA 2'-phosphotransferase, partial [Klebsiella pneumoniae]|nr:RNA 2'-phosphotransferase [Klebsiella pneumoniae]
MKSLPTVTQELLCDVVASNDKKRYTFSSDGKRIRAAQGHSVEIDLGYVAAVPPATLYHGTSVVAWAFIESQGLKAMRR